jgi:hypothetical protein
VLCKESAKPISLAFWHDQPSASISTADECGVDARTCVRRGGSEQDANDSPQAFLRTARLVIGIHADRLSRAGSRACEASPYEQLRSTGHRHRRQINRLTVHTGDSPPPAFKGVIMTTTTTTPSTPTAETSSAPTKRWRVLLAIAALVFAAALAVLTWALTGSSSRGPDTPTARVDPYVQFCDNSPSLCSK